MEEVAFLAPQENSTFCFVELDGVYQPYVDLAVPTITRSIKHAGCFIFVCRVDPKVHFFDLATGRQWSIPLPTESRPLDLVVWQNWLFVAAGGETLLASDDWTAGAAWAQLPCDKEIDALAIHEGKLLAIDNMVTPKWLLSYELTPSGARGPSRFALPTYANYGEIWAAAYWDGKFAILSRSAGREFVSMSVVLMDCSSVDEVGCAYSREASFDPRGDEGFLPLMCARDIAAYRDVLAIAADRYGLIITGLTTEPRVSSKLLQYNYRGILSDDFRQFWPAQSHYRHIVRVRGCDDPAGFIVTSIEGEWPREDDAWEEALAKKLVRANSYFLSYEEIKHRLHNMPPGKTEGTRWKDNSRRAEMRREEGKKSGWSENRAADRTAQNKERERRRSGRA